MGALYHGEAIFHGMKIKGTSDMQGVKAQAGRVYLTGEDFILILLANCGKASMEGAGSFFSAEDSYSKREHSVQAAQKSITTDR
jgi:hypothetical protein